MVIQGKSGEYHVYWSEHGWSYAIPIVYSPTRKWYWPFKKKLWKGQAKPYLNVEKAKPVEIREWFQDAVREYEKYTEAWAEGK